MAGSRAFFPFSVHGQSFRHAGLAVGWAESSWQVVHRRYDLFLAVEGILYVLDFLCENWPDRTWFRHPPVSSIRHPGGSEGSGGATDAVLFEWKLLAFTRFEFAQKL